MDTNQEFFFATVHLKLSKVPWFWRMFTHSTRCVSHGNRE